MVVMMIVNTILACSCTYAFVARFVDVLHQSLTSENEVTFAL